MEVWPSVVSWQERVPIRFQGLKSSDGYRLYQVVNGKRVKFDQSVHGNDFWQTDYDALADTYTVTYNVPLDGLAESKWILSCTYELNPLLH